MKELGYDQVYQLDGGILNYIEQRPNANFEGDCFVFDHRLAVGQDLKPSKTFTRCWHCGNGGSIDEVCELCGDQYRTCEDCAQVMVGKVCSKNCRYQYQRRQAS